MNQVPSPREREEAEWIERNSSDIVDAAKKATYGQLSKVAELLGVKAK